MCDDHLTIEFDLEKPGYSGGSYSEGWSFTIFECKSQGPIECGSGYEREEVLNRARFRREYWDKYFNDDSSEEDIDQIIFERQNL